MKEFSFDSFLSPFTWRYGSQEMREVFSEIEFRKEWRRIWCALAKAQMKAGLVKKEELADLQKNKENIDLEKAHALEKEIRHDLMAEVMVFSEQSPVGGGKIHLGATSMDIEDNAEVMRSRKALKLIKARVVSVLNEFNKRIIQNKNLACIGFTHLQTAEPTTYGYRFSNYAQDLLMDLRMIEFLEDNLKGKGIKGAVGSYSSFRELLKGKRLSPEAMEREVMNELKLKYFDVSSQVYPRKQDFLLLSVLASIAQSLHKFAFDVRVLQNPFIGEVSEPFSKKQVGSSTMPFKRNPMNSERICSLARFVSSLPPIAWNNASNNLLERTLDDSANRRIIIPEAFLALEEALIIAEKVVSGMTLNKKVIERNLSNYGVFAGTEALMVKLTSRGMNRQKAHELIRVNSMKAWNSVQEGKENPLKELLWKNKEIRKRIKRKELEHLLNAGNYLGISKEKSVSFSKELKKVLNKNKRLISKRKEEVF